MADFTFLKEETRSKRPLSLRRLATVTAIVDFPVPSIPFSQNMRFLLVDAAHSSI